MFIKYRFSHHSSRSSLSMMCRLHSPCIPTISKSEPGGTRHLFERDHVEWRPFSLRVIKINKCCKLTKLQSSDFPTSGGQNFSQVQGATPNFFVFSEAKDWESRIGRWCRPHMHKRRSCELPYEIPAPVPDGKYFDNLTHAQSSIHLEVEHGCRVMNESREIISDTFSNFISMCGTQICSITGEAIRTSRRLRKNS